MEREIHLPSSRDINPTSQHINCSIKTLVNVKRRHRDTAVTEDLAWKHIQEYEHDSGDSCTTTTITKKCKKTKTKQSPKQNKTHTQKKKQPRNNVENFCWLDWCIHVYFTQDIEIFSITLWFSLKQTIRAVEDKQILFFKKKKQQNNKNR